MSPTTDTRGLAALAPALRSAFLAHDYTVARMEAALGPSGLAALQRSDVAGIARRAAAAGPFGELLGLFVLGLPLTPQRVAALIPELDLQAAIGCGLLDDVRHPGLLVAAVDLRPADTGRGPQWVISDIDGSMVPTQTRADHVLGVGQASMSLLAITPPGRAGRMLDLGTGCGVQLLAADAEQKVATDITPRCLDFAAATCALNGIDADLRQGSWFAPVEGETFDRIVANPPFVVGPPEVGHTYRESGLHLDGATELVVREACRHLAPEGVATLLGAWVLTGDEDWRMRIASWLPAQGVAAWVLLRDASDPEQYVWTWLTDEGGDPRSPEYREQAGRWLDHFAAEQISGIGFGYIFLQAIDGPTEIECEELSHDFDGGLGAEALAHFTRAAWLRQASAESIDATVFEIAPSVTMYAVTTLDNASGRGGAPTDDGAAQMAPFVVERTSGPRWRHELDEASAAVLRGIEQGALPLAEIAALAAAGFGLDEEAAGPAVRALAIDLLRHGILVPRELPLATLEEQLAAAGNGPQEAR